MYKVVVNFKTYSFDRYSEALNFKLEHGGIIYERVWVR